MTTNGFHLMIFGVFAFLIGITLLYYKQNQPASVKSIHSGIKGRLYFFFLESGLIFIAAGIFI